MSADQTSLTLLRRARDRNPDAWKQLHFLYGPLVDRWCRGWGVQPADMDDIRQEVFQAVATALIGFRRDRPGDSFRGWLWMIARRKFLDLCRKQSQQPEASGGSGAYERLQLLPEPPELPTDEPPEEVSDLHHRALELIKSQFEERTWQAFWKCAVDGLSPVDVARDMGMSPAGVRQAKSRVLRRLKEELGDLLE
jgi:RNA polymerase sigma-70 factor, ECF subfamily